MARIRAFIGNFELKNQMTCTEKDLLSLINSWRQVIVAKKLLRLYSPVIHYFEIIFIIFL